MTKNQLLITDCGQAEVKAAVSNKKVLDFEDGLEYYAAVNAGCTYIVTEDVADFYFADVQIMNAENFLRRCVL